jgi:hypothetical protein
MRALRWCPVKAHYRPAHVKEIAEQEKVRLTEIFTYKGGKVWMYMLVG